MANKSVVKLVQVKARRIGNTYTVRATEALQNGFVGVLGDIEAANPDVRALQKPATANLGESLVLVANTAIIYDNARLGSDQEVNYEMEANEAVRAYEISAKDVVGISREGITTIAVGGAAVAGNYLIPENGSWKLKEITKADYDLLGTKPAFAAKIVREDSVGGALSVAVSQNPVVYVVAEVIQN